MSDKTRINKLRRMAERQGLALRKSKQRDPLALGFGKYMIVDDAGAAVLGADTYSYSASIDDVEWYLTNGMHAKTREAGAA